jgi:uncharacterized protein (TIGR01440 family)
LNSIRHIHDQVSQALTDLDKKFAFTKEHILVIGTSTSEVVGQHIGTSGTKEVAEVIFRALQLFQEKTGVQLAFQCCEHLNRALVVEEKTQRQYNLEQVSVIPIPKAGGSMAAYAYQQLKNPMVVEFIKADAGIDIGDTLIGMHLKHVAVPVRSQIKMIGEAHLTLAITRPKLIGGVRAVYELQEEEGNCD